MQAPKPSGSVNLPGVEVRNVGLRGQTKLWIFAAVIAVAAVIGILHPGDKPLDPAHSVLKPSETGALLFSNAKLSLPVPAGWALSDKQKTDELQVRNADDSCRVLMMRTSVDATPESFQKGMAKKMTEDGNRIVAQPPVEVAGRHAAHMRAQLSSGSLEDIYTVHAGASVYTLVLVQMPDCKADLGPIAKGLRIAA